MRLYIISKANDRKKSGKSEMGVNHKEINEDEEVIKTLLVEEGWLVYRQRKLNILDLDKKDLILIFRGHSHKLN